MKRWFKKFAPLQRERKFEKFLSISKIFLLFLPLIFIILVYFTPSFHREEIITINKGDTLKKVAMLLKEKKLIWNAELFITGGKILRLENKIKAGEYKIGPHEIPLKILLKISRGKAILRRFSVPEGSTIYDISSLCDQTLVCSGEEFIKKAFDEKLLKEMKIPGVSFEGYLFPDTYYFRKGVGSEEVIYTMVKRFNEEFDSSMRERALSLGFTVHQIVTLASIIEKETGISEERKLISAVFHNRLKRNMLLQADPTVIYGLKKFDGNLKKSDLRTRHPYNTYIYPGLPPGPICNPGKDSLIAALYPGNVDYLYFVSRGDGSHDFSSTLKEHNAKVYLYQIKPYLKDSAGR